MAEASRPDMLGPLLPTKTPGGKQQKSGNAQRKQTAGQRNREKEQTKEKKLRNHVLLCLLIFMNEKEQEI